jgi:hypothetical protein
MSDETITETVTESVAEPSLLSQGVQAAQSETNWMSGIEQEYLTSQTVSSAKTANDLAKQVYNLEKVMGKPKIELPSDKWTDKEWGEFYNKVGRPESPDNYKFDGLPQEFEFTEDEIKGLKETLHKQGLTNAQANGVVKAIAEREIQLSQTINQKFDQSQAAARDLLQKEWGNKFEGKLKMAAATLNQLSDPQDAQALEQMAGNNPSFIKFLASIGEKLNAEDSAFKADLSANSATSPISARAEIDSLKGDREFIESLRNPEIPGHKQALDRWTKLHSVAYN